MVKVLRKGIILVSVVLLLASCEKAPITERKQLILISESTEIQLGADAFNKIIKESKLSRDPAIVEKVERVGNRIAKVSNRPDYQWEFIVIEDDSIANAFCLPGGKIGIYTGILPYTKDEEGLAVVISHEIGHAVARHGAERMSMAMLAQLGQVALNLLVGVDDPIVREVVNQAYGLATGIGVILPFSRNQEFEADHIGIALMKKAGYDPRGALRFWERMKQRNQGGETLVYLSTHPVDDQRIAEIEKILQKWDSQR